MCPGPAGFGTSYSTDAGLAGGSSAQVRFRACQSVPEPDDRYEDDEQRQVFQLVQQHDSKYLPR